jgi:hypothetical protein
MSDERENPNPDEAIDPPDQQGGGGEGALDESEEAARAIDPPEQGGGGRTQ